MTDKHNKELDLIVNYSECIYIYGAKKTAERLYGYLLRKVKNPEILKGFLVTDSKDNPKKVCDLPVIDVNCFENYEACILVPHMGLYKNQIYELLNSLGFKNIMLVPWLIAEIDQNERNNLESGKIGSGEKNTKGNVNQGNQKDEIIREKILNILQEEQPDFGCVKPYQSMELIGLDGVRSTEYRIKEYELHRVMKSENDVLDIGCNTGFLDMSIADKVRTITGIEYDTGLVRVADLVKDYLGIKNCVFYNGDFNVWYEDNSNTITYNIIFSFAIHHWLHISSQKYVEMIDTLLCKNGYFCFESHDIKSDVMFKECCNEFQHLGYRIVGEKDMHDDGLNERKYVLFQK